VGSPVTGQQIFEELIRTSLDCFEGTALAFVVGVSVLVRGTTTGAEAESVVVCAHQNTKVAANTMYLLSLSRTAGTFAVRHARPEYPRLVLCQTGDTGRRRFSASPINVSLSKVR